MKNKIQEARDRKENELYITAELAYAKGMTFERFLRAWAMKLTIKLSKKEGEK